MGVQTAFVVDDDDAMRESLRFLLESAHLHVQTFETAEQFLENWESGLLDNDDPACLIADLRMPGLSGLDLQERIQKSEDRWLPMIMITGHGDVPTAVRALKSGVSDFLEKPFSDDVLLDRLFRLLERGKVERARRKQDAETGRKLATLTLRERQVLVLVVEGKPSKQIAAELGVTIKAIEAHRARIMDKMQAQSVQQLVRAVTLYRETRAKLVAMTPTDRELNASRH